MKIWNIFNIDYKKVAIGIVILCLFYTRFVNLGWGLPYPMHPDERNMAVAIAQLSCPSFPSDECLNPHFYAYGQFPLYLAYFPVQFLHQVTGYQDRNITYGEAVLALRLISALASVLTVWFMLKIFDCLVPLISRSVNRIYGSKENLAADKEVKTWEERSTLFKNPFIFLIAAIFIFSPGLIQVAHFGTTESLLALFYVVLIYFGLQIITKNYSYHKYLLLTSLTMGLALATKASALAFAAVPFFSLAFYYMESEDSRKLLRLCFATVNFLCISCIVSILFSPYNFIVFSDFLSSMYYESDIATGKYVAFYIRQFVGTMPVLFQFIYIFPYALGWGIIVLFILGFLFLPFNREVNLMRIAFLAYFIPSAFLFSKWTRFMSPIFPIMLLFATFFLFKAYFRVRLEIIKLSKRNWSVISVANWIIFAVFSFLTILLCLRGAAYLSVYQRPDVRYTASEWVYKNMENGAYILSETANVVDVPIENPDKNINPANKTYRYISFNTYDLDSNYLLQDELSDHLEKADYIFVPSRRVFMNHTCYNEHLVSERDTRDLDTLYLGSKNLVNDCVEKSQDYFAINSYYNRLFSGELGFKKVAQFSAFPKISLFGKTLVEYPDEGAEESWSVFDHPVIRIYKRVEEK